MESEVGIVQGLAILELDVVADLEAEAVAIVVPRDHVAELPAVAVLDEDRAGEVAVDVLVVVAIPVEDEVFDLHVIDVLGVLVSAGIASIFGISLAIVPVLVLLVLLAVYDAISVYRTKHMITLAEGVLETKAPIMVVVPKRADYSFRREGIDMGEGKERGAFLMGMGDLIMPSILVVSSHVFAGAPAVLWVLSAPTLGAMIGSLAGLAVLLFFVNKGKPQAGLPPLNGGAIAGFLVGAALAGSTAWLPLI
jgi:presenilin-like A22 family membrane protease